MCSACAIRDALFVVLLVLLFASAAWLARKIRRSEHFYTDFTQDEPTRPWVAYTGTVPNGTWGTLPWAEAVAGPGPGSSGPGAAARWWGDAVGASCGA